jgi:hypothetical protein
MLNSGETEWLAVNARLVCNTDSNNGIGALSGHNGLQRGNSVVYVYLSVWKMTALRLRRYALRRQGQIRTNPFRQTRFTLRYISTMSYSFQQLLVKDAEGSNTDGPEHPPLLPVPAAQDTAVASRASDPNQSFLSDSSSQSSRLTSAVNARPAATLERMPVEIWMQVIEQVMMNNARDIFSLQRRLRQSEVNWASTIWQPSDIKSDLGVLVRPLLRASPPAWPSDAHQSSILAEVRGLASIFLPRNRLALLEPYSINSPSPATHFPLCHGFLRPSTPLASPREAAALPDDPRLASCSTRRLVCITGRGAVGMPNGR